MRVLVTGAAGFIGSHLCELLASAGHEVKGIDNFDSYYDPALKRMNASDLAQQGITLFDADLNDNLQAVFSKPYDYIYHFAAQPGISSDTSLEDYVTNNLYATRNLLNAVQLYNAKLKMFVNISTSSVYGKEATVGETAVPKPASFYGITKLGAEQLVLALQADQKIHACSIRLYSVYGPRERPEKLYTKLIANILDDTPFPLFEGSLAHERSFTYVGDIVRGLQAIIGREDMLDGEVINLGTDAVNTTREGIEIVEEILQKKLIPDHQPARKGDQLRTAAIIGKARNLLDYAPQFTLRRGLEEQVKWYLKNFS